MPPKEKKRRGRPSSIDAEKSTKLIDAMAQGNYVAVACAIAGVTSPTLYDWIRKGNKYRAENDTSTEESRVHVEFLSAFEKASAGIESACVQRIHLAAERNWQATAWFMERRWPQRWGRQLRVVDSDDLGVIANDETSIIIGPPIVAKKDDTGLDG